MKVYKILSIALFSSAMFFTSCNEEKKAEGEMAVETEKVEMEAEKAKMEAEAKAKEEEMKMEARKNSIASKATANNETQTLVAGLKAAELDEMMAEPGSYTVFAPTENAFSKLPDGKLDELLMPENKEKLQGVLKYHVVPGEIMSDKLAAAIKSGKGKYTFNTVTGEPLTAMMDGDQIVIQDSRGNKAHIVQGNVDASNGVIHLIDNVLMAKK